MHTSLSMITALAIRSKTHERAHRSGARIAARRPADEGKPRAEGETDDPDSSTASSAEGLDETVAALLRCPDRHTAPGEVRLTATNCFAACRCECSKRYDVGLTLHQYLALRRVRPR